ncbi:MAG: uncharacterized protein QOJ40_2591 [Verrucomicrobiota bacterium]
MNVSIIDVNVNLSHWPFRRLQQDEPSRLVSKLREHHVAQAWAGSFDAVLHKDIGGANARLAHDCHEFGHGILLPFGAVNPTLPDWEEDLRRCHEDYKMRGIRLYPNYHGYKLDDPIFVKLLQDAAERGLIVQLVVMMEDQRTQHHLMQMAPVDLAPLASVVSQINPLRVVLLNGFQPYSPQMIAKLAATGKVSFDTATLEGIGGIGNLLQHLPFKYLLFGSNAPLFYFESALLKFKESFLNEDEKKFISSENARGLVS